MPRFLPYLFWAVLGLIVLISLFYVEEDWRGARAWAKAKAEIEAQGESLDPNKFIPPPVPDADNFGVLPIFGVQPTPGTEASGQTQLSVLSQTLEPISNHIPYSKEQGSKVDSLPYLGKWQKGESIDLPAIQEQLEEFCRRQFPAAQIPPNAKLTDIFDLLCPTVAGLRTANATRAECRFIKIYTTQPPYNIPLGPTTAQLQLAKVLSYEERIALLENQPNLAMDDLKVEWKIDSGLRKEPSLISGLVSMGVMAIQLAVVNEGLVKHLWNDQQLASLDDNLLKTDCLREGQFAIRGDVATSSIPNVDYVMGHRSFMMKALLMKRTIFAHDATWDDYLNQGFFILIPDGWYNQFKVEDVKFDLLGTVQMIDPKSRRAFPEREHRAFSLISRHGWWGHFVTLIVQPEINAVKKFAYMQAQVDEARIACRLERYRLAHGFYPATLDELVPAYGSDLPHDIMNGQAYHYKLDQDGTYILYSVGWNQKDDGGQAGSSPYHTSDNLDWLWPNHPDLKKAK